MLVRKYNGFELVCDSCGHTVSGLDDFNEGVEYKKDNGWKSRRNDTDEWEDICPNCQEEGL